MSEMSETPQPTARDAMLFQVILTNMKNKPDVDWVTVASKAGYKNAGCASTRYGQIIKKLTGMTVGQAQALAGTTIDGQPSNLSPSPAKKRGGGSGTNKLATKVEKGTPKKRCRKPKAKNEEIKVFEDEGDEDAARREEYDGMEEVSELEEPIQEYENRSGGHMGEDTQQEYENIDN